MREQVRQSRSDVILRYECPEHGPMLTRQQAVETWCTVCCGHVDPALVEYVPASQRQSAVDQAHAERLYDRLVDIRAAFAAARARNWQGPWTDLQDAITAADAECGLYRMAYPEQES